MLPELGHTIYSSVNISRQIPYVLRTDSHALCTEGVAMLFQRASKSPTNMGLLSWPMKRFWAEVMFEHWMKVDGKIGCAFSSAGGWGGGMEIACQSLLMLLMNFGFLVFGVADYAARLTTLHYRAAIHGVRPQNAAIESGAGGKFANC